MNEEILCGRFYQNKRKNTKEMSAVDFIYKNDANVAIQDALYKLAWMHKEVIKLN